jgi:hypothetical protein
VREAKRTKPVLAKVGPAKAVPPKPAAAAKPAVKAAKAVAKAAEKAAEKVAEKATEKTAKRATKSRPPAGPEPVNEQIVYANFVVEHPVGTPVDGTVERFASHGAYVLLGQARGYVALRDLGNPPPRSAREVLNLGETRPFTVHRFDPARRGIDVIPAGDAFALSESGSNAAEAVAPAAGSANTRQDAEEAPVSPAARKAGGRKKAAAKKAPARKKAAAKRAPARKSTAKRTAKKSTAKRTAKKAGGRKKATAKKAPARKRTAKKAGGRKKAAAKKAPARKRTAKKAGGRKKATAKRAPARKRTTRRRTAKKA